MQPQPPWLEIEITREGAEVHASARAGGRLGQAATHPLGPGIDAAALLAFGDGMRAAADRGKPLGTPFLAQAEAIHRALFRGGIDALRGVLQPPRAARSASDSLQGWPTPTPPMKSSTGDPRGGFHELEACLPSTAAP